MKKRLIVCVSMLALWGCARSQAPIVDTKGVNMTAYQRDLAECEKYALQVDDKTLGSTVGGAAVGGTAGAIIGNSDTAKKGAGIGALTGLLKGAAKTSNEEQKVVKRCLQQRGYKVLN